MHENYKEGKAYRDHWLRAWIMKNWKPSYNAHIQNNKCVYINPLHCFDDHMLDMYDIILICWQNWNKNMLNFLIMYYDFNWQSINNHDIWRFETLYIIFCVEKFLKLQILWNLHFWNLQWSCFLFLGVDWIVMEHARIFTCGGHPHVKTHVQPRNLS